MKAYYNRSGAGAYLNVFPHTDADVALCGADPDLKLWHADAKEHIWDDAWAWKVSLVDCALRHGRIHKLIESDTYEEYMKLPFTRAEIQRNEDYWGDLDKCGL
jgi:hypothetical protein